MRPGLAIAQGVGSFNPLPLFPSRRVRGYTLRAPNRTLGQNPGAQRRRRLGMNVARKPLSHKVFPRTRSHCFARAAQTPVLQWFPAHSLVAVRSCRANARPIRVSGALAFSHASTPRVPRRMRFCKPRLQKAACRANARPIRISAPSPYASCIGMHPAPSTSSTWQAARQGGASRARVARRRSGEGGAAGGHSSRIAARGRPRFAALRDRRGSVHRGHRRYAHARGAHARRPNALTPVRAAPVRTARARCGHIRDAHAPRAHGGSEFSRPARSPSRWSGPRSWIRDPMPSTANDSWVC